jgi:hypothetical protein
VASISNLSAVAVVTLFVAGFAGDTKAQDIDALFLSGYWCNTQTNVKTENIPRNRTYLLSRDIKSGGDDEAQVERLIDIVGDVRGQRIILAQRLKNANGTECKTNCTLAQRVVNKDLVEVGDWNSSTGVFKSNSPREYVHRCDK